MTRALPRHNFAPARALAAATLLALVGAAPARADDAADLRRGFELIDAWRIDEARPLAEALWARSPGDGAVLALVAEVKLHMGDYAGALHFYERARDAGAPDGLLRNAALAEAARTATDGYEEVVTPRFIIRHSPGKDAILVPYTEETLEKALAALSELLGWRPEGRVVVELYPSAATLADVSTLTRDEIKASGTIALCKWNRLMVTTPRAVVLGYHWRDTIAHELAHLVIGGASKNTVPIWLHEGIAKFVETAWRGEPGLGLPVESQRSLAEAAAKGKLIPFEKMHPSMAKLKSQEETSLAFAEVFTFVEYMVALKGWGAMREVLQRMSAGASDAEAIEVVFGVPLTTLSERWMASLKTRKIRVEGVEVGADRPVVLKDKSDTPDDALHGVSKLGRRYARAADLLFLRGRPKAAQVELEKAVKAGKAPMLSAKLAVVALANGDLDVAEKASRAALDGNSDLAGPHVTLAEILLRRDKKAEALKPLEGALAVNPFDPRIHELLVRAAPEGSPLRKQAELARATLAKPNKTPRELGTGGKVVVEAQPFSRVYVDDVPTRSVTPTGELLLAPGKRRLRLVPPTGAPIEQVVDIEKKSATDAPQRITPDMRGS